jgi:hypothetical protein
MSDEKALPTLKELSKVEPDDFFDFLERKNISKLCVHCGEQSMQVAVVADNNKSYLRLIESKILNIDVGGKMVPQYMRSCGNCFSMHSFVSLYVYNDIVKYKQEEEEKEKNKQQGDVINDQE